MTDLTIRDVPEDVHRRLRERAAENGRTPENEARAALENLFSGDSGRDLEQTWLAAIDAIQNELRATNGGELPRGVVDEFLAEKRLVAAAELAEVERYLSRDGRSGAE